MADRIGTTAVRIIDAAQRDRLIEEFGPVVRYIAQRLAFRLPPSLDVQDLIHAGVIGVMDAIEKYDPSKQVQFKTYAEFRIRGAMLDQLRSLDWVPRSVREKVGRLQAALEKIEKRLERHPTTEELAGELQISLEECEHLLSDARGVALLSLDDLGLHESEPRRLLETLADGRSEDPLLSLLAEETKRKLLSGIKALPEKERLVIALYYQDDLTMREIGQVLGVTESRVCQLHAQAIVRLKGKLARSKE